jgi:ribosome assembly protein YihI (activator of Der GTPase)
MDPDIRFHPAVLKIAEALHQADQERLAQSSQRKDPRHGSRSIGAIPLLLAKVHQAHGTR